MASEHFVLGLVGSPNRDGRTNQLVTATLAGATAAGARTELVHLADHVVGPCHDCLPWVCVDNLECTYDDPAFAFLAEKVLACGGLVLGTPVYWWDTSAMVRLFILKMFRVYARSGLLNGLPALGITIAGGGGNGLISALRPLYHFFQMLQMRALAPVPANRFNFDGALAQARASGAELACLAAERRPFARTPARCLPPDSPAHVSGLEERLLWYDSLPYLSYDRFSERRLVAQTAVAALPDGIGETLALDLVRADLLNASGQRQEALCEITRVYETALRQVGGGR